MSATPDIIIVINIARVYYIIWSRALLQSTVLIFCWCYVAYEHDFFILLISLILSLIH